MTRLFNTLCVATLTLTLSSCANMYLTQGKEDYENFEYADAIESLERSVEKKASTEGSILLAQAYSKTKQPVAAIYEFEKIKTEPEFTEALKLEYASNLLGAEKYDEALATANEVLSKNPESALAQNIALSASRVGLMKQDSSLFEISKFNVAGLNTLMSPVKYNESILVSGGRDNLKIKDGYTGLSYLDIYIVSDSGLVTKLPFSNSKYHDAMPAYDENSSSMYFTRSNQASANELNYGTNNTSHPQIYMVKAEDSNWSEPQKLKFNNDNYIYAHPSLSSDGKTMYFSSNQPGGLGGMDLYETNFINNEWSLPKNLGPKINTPKDEAFPTLKDDETLYFSSDGHQTLGGLDILFATRSNDAWSNPTHLSYPLNSSKDDFGLIYTEDEKGLLSSDRSGKDQIYSFQQFLPELILEGTVADLETGEPIENIQITLKNLTDNTSEIVPIDAKGNFTYKLMPNKEYEVLAEDISQDQTYFNASKKNSTQGIKDDEKIKVNFNLDKIKVAEDPNNIKPGEDGTYPIPNIYWDYNKWKVREDAMPYLNMVSDLLVNNPGLKVEVRSHCDSRGSDAFNRKLSQKRAKEVTSYLIAQGIEKNRLTSKGLGESQLINNCADGTSCTEEKHQQNRRSEFVIIDKRGNIKQMN